MTTPSPEFIDLFERRGFSSPFRVVSVDDCPRTLSKLKMAPPASIWKKGNAASSESFYRLGTAPVIVNHVSEILGEDVVLWGAHLIHLKPGSSHQWHTDIESSSGNTVSVWLGLSNTKRQSSLRLLSGSHRFGMSLQERASGAGVDREGITEEAVMNWATDLDPSSNLNELEISDGEAVIFDGQLWHASENALEDKTRIAVLFQYAKASQRVRVPDLTQRNWPFHYRDDIDAPCILVNGSANESPNKIVNPPAGEMQTLGSPEPDHLRAGATKAKNNSSTKSLKAENKRPMLSSMIHRFEIPLPENTDKGYQRFPVLRGRSLHLQSFSSHASVLSSGNCPHPFAGHPDDEVLVVLDGEIVLEIIDDLESGVQRTESLQTGSFVHYAARSLHTVRNESSKPVSYLMFKWIGSQIPDSKPTGTSTIVEFNSIAAALGGPEAKGYTSAKLLNTLDERPAGLKSHISKVEPGGGYEPHIDSYDVALLILTGEINTLGENVGPGTVVYYAAGEPHGIRNYSDVSSTYLVFEFHAGFPQRSIDVQTTNIFKRLQRLFLGESPNR